LFRHIKVDLGSTIRQLKDEKKRLDRLIASLERMLAEGRSPGGKKDAPRSRRGRKTMSERERREVSERMARYWSARRASKAAESPNRESPGGASGSRS